MIDFSILITLIKYTIGALTLAIVSIMQHRRFARILIEKKKKENQIQIVLGFMAQGTK